MSFDPCLVPLRYCHRELERTQPLCEKHTETFPEEYIIIESGEKGWTRVVYAT